jgi:cell division protein FtsW (lipid II flippase)
MHARQATQIDLPPTGMLPAVLALLVAVIVLMAFPAAVAVISIADGRLLGRAEGWLSSGLALAAPLEVARLGLTLALAGALRAAKEDP